MSDATRPESEAAELRGAAFGRFRVTGVLGSGGMGVVLAAQDPDLDRPVALKILRPTLPGALGEDQARLSHEARVMARLAHPNVVTVYEVGALGDQLFVAMELIDGATLRSWLAERRRGWREIVAMFVEVGRGLAAAHAEGVIHRDFKPDNVLIGRDGRPRVTDFGIAGVDGEAQAPDGAPALTTVTPAGTPAYMSPEQWSSRVLDPRSDQFAFCVTLWEALHRERPFEGSGAIELRDAVERGALRDPVARIPRWLDAALRRGLAREPDARWPDLPALLDHLARRARRRRWLGIAYGAAGAATAAIVAAAVWPAPVVPSCDSAGAQIAAVWSDAVQRSVADAFHRTGRPYADDTFRRVDASFGGWLAAWAGAHRQVCEATHVRHEQSEALLDVRMRCLGRAKGEVEALVALLREADVAVLDRAAQAAADVGDVAACTRTTSLAAFAAPRDPALAREAEGLRREIARVEALFKLGRGKQGVADARALVTRARRLGYPPVLAPALFSASQLEANFGEPTTAIDALYEVTRIGAELDDAQLVARANTLLVYVLGWRAQRFDAAEVAYQLAQGQAARAGNPPRLLAQLHDYRALTLYGKGEYAAALPDYQRALALYITASGPDDYTVAKTLSGIADTELKLGRLADVAATHERAIAIAAKTLGPDHLVIAIMLTNSSMTRLALFEFDAAAQLLERALALKEKVLAADDPLIATTAHNLGIARVGQRRLPEARALLDRAIQIREAKLGLEHPLLATSYGVLASIRGFEGKFEQARDLYDRAVAIKLKAYGSEHTSVAITYREYADLLLANDRITEARGAIDRALAIGRHASKDDPGEQYDAANVLGDVLMAERRVAEARDTFREALATGEKLYGPAARPLFKPLVGLSEALAATGDAAGAASAAERAIALARAMTADHQAIAQFALARAQWAAGDRTPAVATAREARARLAGLAYRTRHGAVIDRWLATAAAPAR